MDYEYYENNEALDELGCVAQKSKESIGSFTYNNATECFDYPGTKCKLGNQCGAKGTKTRVYQNNHETLKMWNDGTIIVSSQKNLNYMQGWKSAILAGFQTGPNFVLGSYEFLAMF